MEQKFKRRNYFIDKAFQLTFVKDFSLVMLLSTSLTGFLLYYLSKSSTTMTIENTKVVAKSTADFILPSLVVILLAVTIVSAIVCSVMVIFLSHRIAGPMYRLKLEVEFITQGDLSRTVRIRNTDQFQEMAKSFTAMADQLRAKHKEIKLQSQEIKSFLEAKNYAVSSDDKQNLSQKINQLNKSLDFFKV